MHLDPDAAAVPDFGLQDRLAPGSGPWHAHRHHQLLFTASGRLELETQHASWLLPPQRAAWIRGGVRHRVHVPGPCALRTLYLDPTDRPLPWPCRVFAVTPLAREMLLQAAQWGPTDPPAAAAPFFQALGLLAVDWGHQAERFRLPRAQSPELARALRWTRAHLDTATAAGAAQAAGLTPRTFSRRFKQETGESWRQTLHALRMHQASAWLEQGVSVTEVAISLGFSSVGSFSRLFKRWAGQSPSTWAAL